VTAREKFKIGQRVQMTEEGRRALFIEAAEPGNITGIVAKLEDRFPDCLSVDRDAGFRTFDPMDFWEPVSSHGEE